MRRVGLALGGGSARGLAHIGVIQVFEEQGVPIDFVAGTSMGSIIGALYASGLGPKELTDVARSIDWATIFSGRGDRRLEPVVWRVDDVPSIVSVGVARGRFLAPAAAYSDYRIGRVLTTHLAAAGLRAGSDFDRLPIPFRAVATDLAKGDRVVLQRGDLPRAVRASMSLPVVFPPVEIDGRLLVDGGLVDNVPSGVVRAMGADLVIAVDVGLPPKDLGEDADVLTVVNRLTEFMMAKGNRSFAEPPDVRIRPDLEGVDSKDFDRFEDLIERGRQAGLAALADVLPRLCGRSAATPRPLVVGSGRLSGGPVTSVTVEGLHRVHERLVTRRLRVEVGREFDLAAAQKGMDAVWASNLFSSAWLELASPEGKGLEVRVHVRERPAVRVGVAVAYNEADNARGVLRFRNGNLLGLGERLDAAFVVDSGRAELQAAMGSASLAGSSLGYRIGLRAAEDKPIVYDGGGSNLGRTRFRQFRATASGQRAIGGDGLFDLGLAAGTSEVDERAGIPFDERADTVVKATGRFVTDTLDNRFWPASGWRLDARGEQTITALGSSLSYPRASLRIDGYWKVGKRGLVSGHVFGGGAGSRAPVYDYFRVGGPTLIPGRSREEIWGPWAMAGSLGLAARLSPQWRLGVEVGAGNAWAERTDIRFDTLRAGGTLALSRLTPVGPIALGLGLGAGDLKVYVSLGYQ